MNEGYPVRFIGGALDGQSLMVDTPRDTFRVYIPPPLGAMDLAMALGPAGPVRGAIRDEQVYKRVSRINGPRSRAVFYVLDK